MDDAQAIAAILNGDRDVYATLVDRHKKMVYAIAWSQLGDVDLSEDAAQEAFVKAYCYLTTLKDRERFDCWLAMIARNVCKTYQRRALRERAAIRRWTEFQASESDGNRSSLSDEVSESFEALPPAYREALTVFYIEGKSARDAAGLLGIKEPAMKVRLHRARAALRSGVEPKLEAAVGAMRPSDRFTRSVTSLLPLMKTGGLGAGGIASALGKLSATLAAKVWLGTLPFVLIFAAPFAGMLWWQSNWMCASFKDTSDNNFRKREIQQTSFGWGAVVILIAIAMFITMRTAGIRAIYDALAVVGAYGIYQTAKVLRVNRTTFAIAGFTSIVVFLVGSALIGLGVLPIQAGMLLTPLCSAATLFARKQMPQRRDFNLFLRCATGGLVEDGAEEAPRQLRLTDLELAAFATFLGEQYLVIDRIEAIDGMILKLPNVRPMMQWSRGSSLSITRSGKCYAQLGYSDCTYIERLSITRIEPSSLEQRLSSVLRRSLVLFCDGDISNARALLEAKTESDIFVPGAAAAMSKRLRTLTILSIALSSVAAGLMLVADILSKYGK